VTHSCELRLLNPLLSGHMRSLHECSKS
jgi:hypothetical protein